MHKEPLAVLIVAGVAFIFGLAMLYWVERRKFHRRNAYGVELFPSFGGLIVRRAGEGFAAAVGFVLVLMNGFYVLGYFLGSR